MTERDRSERIFGGLTNHYFNRFELELPPAFKYHLEQRTPADAVRHCFLVAARSKILALDIGLSDDVIDDLILGAALHDTFPNGSVTPRKKTHEFLWDDFLHSYEETQGRLERAGFSKKVVGFAGAAGHLAYWQAEKILKNNPNEYGIAFLIVHYVDAYTSDDGQITWVEPEEVREQKNEDDVIRNELDYRIEQKELDCFGLGRSGVGRYRDEFGLARTPFQAELSLCKQIEEHLTARINIGRTRSIDSSALPRYVDTKLKAKIINGANSRKT